MKNTLPRVAAVHDMSGYGKCSLTVAIPVLSAAGIEVSPLPTALLSTNTLFKDFTFYDFTPHMEAYVAHWKAVGVTFDCLYSGFLGSEAQIAFVRNLKEAFGNPLSVIDPVMGDNGNIIGIYTPGMLKNMAELVAVADVATPNVTEGCILAGIDYCGESPDSALCRMICEKILALGAKNAVLTGVVRGGGLYNCAIEESGYTEHEIEHLDFHMHGTGDLFTRVLTAGLVRGFSLSESVDSAAAFVRDAMIVSRDVEKSDERGVSFEPIVYKLHTGMYKK